MEFTCVGEFVMVVKPVLVSFAPSASLALFGPQVLSFGGL
jgi:hypothetical protein